MVLGAVCLLAGILLAGCSPGNETLHPVKVHNLWGYIDITGKTVIEPLYHTASVFSDGLAYVSDLNGWSCKHRGGKTIFYADY